MCDRCRTLPQILRMVGISPEDVEDEDELSKAKRRLRCYYECVTEDILREERDEGEAVVRDLEQLLEDDDDDDELGLPRY